MADCRIDELKKSCTCTYNCRRRGKCCECVIYHREMGQLPGCFFAEISPEAEKTYNRDFEYFAKLINEK